MGEGIKYEHLNDDVLGRVMDKLYEYGVSYFFPIIADKSCKKLGIVTKYAHLDSTSFHVDGKYNSDEPSSEDENKLL